MGSGFRTFQSGEVLTASNVQNYLMEQSVMTFAGTAALGSAIGTAVEPGMVAYLTDSDQIIHYRADAVQGTAWQAMPMVGVPANVVINGAMQVAQRGTSTASITAADTFVVDRFATNIVTLGTWTMSQESDAPTGSGFRKSLKLLVTTADASPAAGDFAAIKTTLEGQNVQQFLKGTASAKQFSMTMWVKSGTTGTFIVELVDADNTRFCSQSYSVNAANTWEKKTLVFPADTTGAFDNDNGGSLAVNFYLAAGSTRNSGTLQTTWGTSTTTGRATGQVNLAAAAVAGTNYWQITGVQLEAGSVATPFEFEDYGTTLAKCQRYYYNIGLTAVRQTIGTAYYYNATQSQADLPFPTTMRSQPTLVSSSGTDYYAIDRNSGTDTMNSWIIYDASVNAAMIYNASESSGTAGQAGHLFSNNAAASIAFSAEL